MCFFLLLFMRTTKIWNEFEIGMEFKYFFECNKMIFYLVRCSLKNWKIFPCNSSLCANMRNAFGQKSYTYGLCQHIYMWSWLPFFFLFFVYALFSEIRFSLPAFRFPNKYLIIYWRLRTFATLKCVSFVSSCHPRQQLLRNRKHALKRHLILDVFA